MLSIWLMWLLPVSFSRPLKTYDRERCEEETRGGKGGRAITQRISTVKCVEIIEQKRKTLRQTKHNTTQTTAGVHLTKVEKVQKSQINYIVCFSFQCEISLMSSLCNSSSVSRFQKNRQTCITEAHCRNVPYPFFLLRWILTLETGKYQRVHLFHLVKNWLPDGIKLMHSLL